MNKILYWYDNILYLIKQYYTSDNKKVIINILL